ncbi:MAG: response regulator [Gemmatimonadota bacterium]|nr:MAG: response regulator [Gemmatimonadota bacterium]
MPDQRLKILVVDDDEGVRDSLKVILEDEYDVWDADGGKKALNVFMSMKPNLVFLDLVLPDMGGVDVLEKIKRLCPMTPVVILTAYSNINSALHAIESGASDYIPKPFSVEEIQVRTAELLGNEKNRPLDCESFRQRWLTRKKDIRERFLTTAFVPTS